MCHFKPINTIELEPIELFEEDSDDYSEFEVLDNFIAVHLDNVDYIAMRLSIIKGNFDLDIIMTENGCSLKIQTFV